MDNTKAAIRANLIDRLIESSDFNKILFSDIIAQQGINEVENMKRIERGIIERMLNQPDEIYEFSVDKNRDNIAPLIEILK